VTVSQQTIGVTNQLKKNLSKEEKKNSPYQCYPFGPVRGLAEGKGLVLKNSKEGRHFSIYIGAAKNKMFDPCWVYGKKRESAEKKERK